MSTARIIGLGQSLAGDDGVGVAVVEYLRRQVALADVELFEARAPVEAIELLLHDGPVVIVDALLAGVPGQVRALSVGDLDTRSPYGVSSHGMALRQAIALAQTLWEARCTARLYLIGVTTTPPRPGERRLTLEVALAVPLAAATAVALAKG